MGCNLAVVVGANLFAQLPNGQIYRANKFAPTDRDVSRNQLGLNGEADMPAVKIQENFEGLEI
jgi:hypothetical protein